MELTDFLQRVTPAGRVIVARMVPRKRPDGTPYNGFAHIVCSSHAEAAEAALAMVSGGHNVYFALASWKQGFFKDARGKKVVRVRENVDSLKALWLDIDFKGDYKDAKTAVLAVKVFCQQAALPPPSILVGSGNGLHAYWPFTEAVPVERWQGLADAFKDAAKDIGLKADGVCTSDACRVLRPPGTKNFKDPKNPKDVTIFWADDTLHSPDVLEAALTPWKASRKLVPPSHIKQDSALNDLTSGVGKKADPLPLGKFDILQKNCAVAKWVVETGGKDCAEPEWKDVLQLLKHCEDGADWIHKVSNGHPGYSEAATEQKFAERLANTAGPTLCKTFEAYRPEKCAKCPHSGFIKTPLQVAHTEAEDATGLPFGWRVAPDEKGMERLMLTDPTNNVREWVRVFRHIPLNFRPVKSIATGQFDMLLDIRLKGTDVWTVTLPMSMLGNPRKLVETLASFGVVLKAKEVQPFGELMASWLEKLQNAKRVADVTEQLGWITTGEKVTGFACSPTVYHHDGRIRNDVRPAREFASLAKLYEPRGELEPWKRVAAFVAEQNNPSLTAVLAASFGAPLLKFVGIQGGILSLVSTASGVGKSSVLKLSQAVWGSPVHAMNSVDDTPKSVAKKLGFLNNLPAYWDELRGKQTVDGFCNLAFQITQGREKSRLDSAANLRDSQTWETMLIVASNESIFEAMARRTTGSDAGMVRTFELEMTETPHTDKTSAEVTLLFESLAHNYGHAGRAYAQYLATHTDEVRKLVQQTYLHVAGNMESAERFWYGIITILLVGASLAHKLDLVHIDIKKLHTYLVNNLGHLRGRTSIMNEESTIREIFADYLRDRGSHTLLIDKFGPDGPGRPNKECLCNVKESPKSGRCVIVRTNEPPLKVRFASRDFVQWLIQRELPAYGMLETLQRELGAKKIRCVLGLGTTYAGPRVWAMEVELNAADLSNPGGSSDSSTSTEPEG